jgi:CBS domain-containing protein
MAHTVRDYMSRKFVTFRPDMDILEATDLMVRHGISGGPVVDRTGNLVGVLSEIDCLRGAVEGSYHGSGGGYVREVMKTEFESVDVDDSIMDVARMMINRKDYYYRAFPVMKHNRVVGRIMLRDVLGALEDMSRENDG